SSVDRDDDGFRAELLRNLGDGVRASDRGAGQGDTRRTRADEPASIVNAAHAPADGEGDGDGLGGAADDVDHRVPFVGRRGDVEEDEFVSAFAVVAGSELDGIASVAQTREVDTFDEDRKSVV